MKNVLLSLFCLTSLFLSAQTWCESGSVWHYNYVNFGYQGYVEITYTGDTLINGQTANKLRKVQAVYGPNNQYDTVQLGFEYTRENNGIVTILNDQNNWDTLYNFTAQVGDSWQMAKQPFSSGTCDSNSRLTVTSMGNLSIHGQAHQYWVVAFDNWGMSDTLVEGIGFIGSYLLPYDACDAALDGNEGGVFRCYQNDNLSTYKPNYSGSCDYIVGLENDQNGLNRLQIYPSPARDILNLQGDFSAETRYAIIDLAGKTKQKGQLQLQIEIGDLSSGVYFLELQGESTTIRRRFVVD